MNRSVLWKNPKDCWINGFFGQSEGLIEKSFCGNCKIKKVLLE